VTATAAAGKVNTTVAARTLKASEDARRTRERYARARENAVAAAGVVTGVAPGAQYLLRCVLYTGPHTTAFAW
jgi:hypothetical protein